MQHQRNARFTTYVNGSPVKITLRPQQSLEHRSGGPTDEGYNYRHTVYEHDGNYVRARHTNESKCCDGRFSSYADLNCPIGLLKSQRYEDTVWLDEHGPIARAALMLPDWQNDESGQRDYSAEAAGY